MGKVFLNWGSSLLSQIARRPSAFTLRAAIVWFVGSEATFNSIVQVSPEWRRQTTQSTEQYFPLRGKICISCQFQVHIVPNTSVKLSALNNLWCRQYKVKTPHMDWLTKTDAKQLTMKANTQIKLCVKGLVNYKRMLFTSYHQRLKAGYLRNGKEGVL